MQRFTVGRFVPLVLLGAIAVGSVGHALAQAPADARFSKADAESLSSKLKQITDHGVRGGTAKLTPVSEREVNAYLRYEVPDKLPPGMLDPTVVIVGNGRLSGRALVDLDVVKQRRQSPPGLFDPLSLLSGRVLVGAVGLLRTQAGVGRFELESAEIGGVTVPKTVLQELISMYSRSPERPNGYSLDSPFELPARIIEIRVEQQNAVIVQ